MPAARVYGDLVPLREYKCTPEDVQAVADEIKRLKPSTVKGRYITKATITSTMGPGIPLDTATLA